MRLKELTINLSNYGSYGPCGGVSGVLEVTCLEDKEVAKTFGDYLDSIEDFRYVLSGYSKGIDAETIIILSWSNEVLTTSSLSAPQFMFREDNKVKVWPHVHAEEGALSLFRECITYINECVAENQKGGNNNE